MPDHSTTFLLVTVMVLVTIILISGMKYFSAARTTRAITGNEDERKALAADLSEIKTRLGAIEKILREVE